MTTLTLTFWHGFGAGLLVGAVVAMVSLALVVAWALASTADDMARDLEGE